jgi:hypothetical protein
VSHLEEIKRRRERYPTDRHRWPIYDDLDWLIARVEELDDPQDRQRLIARELTRDGEFMELEARERRLREVLEAVGRTSDVRPVDGENVPNVDWLNRLSFIHQTARAALEEVDHV